MIPNNINCTSPVEVLTTERISKLSEEVLQLSIGVNNDIDELYIYMKGPKTSSCNQSCSSDKPNCFYEHIEANLQYIRNNLYNIQEIIGHIR